MEKSKQKIIGIGWDVAGWVGKKSKRGKKGSRQGLAVLEWDLGKGSLNPPKDPICINIGVGEMLTPDVIYKKVTGEDINYADTKVIIAIDAPLGFPVDFRKLVNGNFEEFHNFTKPSSEIENTLAYRETERHIAKVLKKKPFSAPFQTLGNNATVAITHMLQWEKNCGFKAHPFSGEHIVDDDRIIIEVYPALIKGEVHPLIKGKVHREPMWEDFLNKIPELAFESIKYKDKSKEISKDAYDAALCAIMAVAYGLDLEKDAGRIKDHPMGLKAVKPKGLSETEKREEGWIYYFHMT